MPNVSYAEKSQDRSLDESFTKKYSHNDPYFTFRYPLYWDLKHGHDNWIATFYDDIDEWEMHIDIYHYDVDQSTAKTLPQKYVQYMFVTYEKFCNQRTYEKDGYVCFDFVPIDFKTSKKNNFDTRQVTFSWTQMFENGDFFENTSTITDILYNEKLLNIQYQADTTEYKKHIGDYNQMVDSVKFDKIERSKL